jgi:hypothetical protein
MSSYDVWQPFHLVEPRYTSHTTGVRHELVEGHVSMSGANDTRTFVYPFTGGHIELGLEFREGVLNRCVGAGQNVGRLYDQVQQGSLHEVAVAANALADMLQQQPGAWGDFSFFQGTWFGRDGVPEFDVVGSVYSTSRLDLAKGRTVLGNLLQAVASAAESALKVDFFDEGKSGVHAVIVSKPGEPATEMLPRQDRRRPGVPQQPVVRAVDQPA